MVEPEEDCGYHQEDWVARLTQVKKVFMFDFILLDSMVLPSSPLEWTSTLMSLAFMAAINPASSGRGKSVAFWVATIKMSLHCSGLPVLVESSVEHTLIKGQ